MICSHCGHDAASAKFCPECGTALQGSTGARPPAADTNREGERRQLTVLFCDLVGSTALSQQLDAEEWRDIVVRYQRAARTAVERWGGYVAKELGDGLLVYFGWPTAREDDPERAIRAGLAVLEAMGALENPPVSPFFKGGEERVPPFEKGGPGGISPDAAALHVRVGMHTGPVVIADGGEVFGETPNIAARVQAAAEPDTVVVTAATQRLAAGIFVLEERAAQELKGVRDPVVLYRVLRPSGVRSRLDVAAGRLTPFIGRDMEIGTLLDRWERVIEGQGQNVLLVADAGVGKSRLAWELRKRLSSQPHTWLECRATPYTQATPFLPVVELVVQGLALQADDSEADKIAKLERGLGLLRDPLSDTLPVVARLLALRVPERYPNPDLGPDMERQRTLEILADWNLALGEVQPLVLLVEDLHWCDPSSLQLLGRIIEQSAPARVLFIGTARPEFTSPWPARSNTTTLQLARLTKRQAREMVMELGASLPGEAVETLIARGDGVPLYIEELTKTVAERGAEAIPATLADSLMARLDRLSTAKEVAQRAAVLGREFPSKLLAAIADLDEAALSRGLARLVEAEILFVRGEPPSATYTFKHALVQEAAYESLLKRVRQQLHGRVYDALRGREADGGDAEPEVLAHHAEHAGRSEEAIAQLERAATAARDRSAYGEAVRHLRRAIALLTTQPQSKARDTHEAELQVALGGCSSVSAGYAHAATRAAFERAAALPGGTRIVWTMARGGVANVENNSGSHERGRALAEEVLAAQGGTDDDERSVIASVIIANAEYWLGRFESSVQHAKRVLAVYERAPDRHFAHYAPADSRIVVLGYAAWSLGQLGRLDDAMAHSAEAMLHAERGKQPFSLAFALSYDAVVQYICCDYAAQQARCQEAMALSDRFGFPLWSGVMRFFYSLARLMLGDTVGFAEMLDGLTRAAQTATQAPASSMLGMLADAQLRLGALTDAQTTLARATALASQLGERNWEAEMHLTDGELARAMGAPLDDVLARLRKAQAVAQELGALRSELCAATSMARVLRDAGDPAAARAELAPVYGKFTQGFGTPLLVEAKALLEELAP